MGHGCSEKFAVGLWWLQFETNNAIFNILSNSVFHDPIVFGADWTGVRNGVDDVCIIELFSSPIQTLWFQPQTSSCTPKTQPNVVTIVRVEPAEIQPDNRTWRPTAPEIGRLKCRCRTRSNVETYYGVLLSSFLIAVSYWVAHFIVISHPIWSDYACPSFTVIFATSFRLYNFIRMNWTWVGNGWNTIKCQCR